METTALALVQTAVANIDQISQGIAALQKQYGGVVYDVKTPTGMEAAKADRKIVRAPRLEVERIRKEAKRPLLDLTNKLDSEARRITAAISAIEDPIVLQIEAEEARIEAEKQAQIQAELKRIAMHKERIVELRAVPQNCAFSSAAVILELIDDIEPYDVGPGFQEYQQEAQDAKVATLFKLRELYAGAVAKESEIARIKAESDALVLRQQQQAAIEAAAAKERKAAQDEIDRLGVEAQKRREAEEREWAIKRESEAQVRREEEAKIEARRIELAREEENIKMREAQLVQPKPVELPVVDHQPVAVPVVQWSFGIGTLTACLWQWAHESSGHDGCIKIVNAFLQSEAAKPLRTNGD